MAIQLGLTRNENKEDHILIHLETEDLLRLERIFKGMSHCLVEYTIPEILSLDKSQKFDLKLQNNNENIGLKQTRTDYFEWKQRSETWYIFRGIITEMYRNSRHEMFFELTKDIRNQDNIKIFIYWEK